MHVLQGSEGTRAEHGLVATRDLGLTEQPTCAQLGTRILEPDAGPAPAQQLDRSINLFCLCSTPEGTTTDGELDMKKQNPSRRLDRVPLAPDISCSPSPTFSQLSEHNSGTRDSMLRCSLAS
jgi:hypothetical protein